MELDSIKLGVRMCLLALSLVVIAAKAHSGELQLRWTDNSSTEDGFTIERKKGTAGTYAQIATVGADFTSYTDSTVADGEIYCYRLFAFNAGGASPYSSEGCAPARSTTQTFSLTVASEGTGSGTITSNPTGITCGADCSELYNSGALVVLNAVPAAGSVFSGWSGTGCTTGTVTMSTHMTCVATFTAQPVATGYTLTVAKEGSGAGTVTTSDGSISCGSTCSHVYSSGTSITLNAIPASGSVFAGWSGCCLSKSATLTVNLSGDTSVTATFLPQVPAIISDVERSTTRIGVFRPSTGQWFLDYNGNGQWDGCDVDICINSFGQEGQRPVVGNWNGDGISDIGVFDENTGEWNLDTNGNRLWDGCTVDACIGSFGRPGDWPVTREIAGLDVSIIGTFTPRTIVKVNGRYRTIRGLWNFDSNGNARFDGCSVDECDTFGSFNQLPVTGDWNGTGSEEIGLFLPRYGRWYLDLNGNGSWDGCRSTDKCLGPFGAAGDLPVAGDWDGTGSVRIGVFRPSTAQWFFDLNGNGTFDQCTVDGCVGPFGEAGDLPVVGKW